MDPGMSSVVKKQDLEERSKPNLDHYKPSIERPSFKQNQFQVLM
jgi:hypothetical protein